MGLIWHGLPLLNIYYILSHSPLTTLSNNTFPHNLFQKVAYFSDQTNKFVVAQIIFPHFLMSMGNTFAIPQSQHQLDKCIKNPYCWNSTVHCQIFQLFFFFPECRLSDTCILSALSSSVILPSQMCQFSLYALILIRHLGFTFTLQIITFM